MENLWRLSPSQLRTLRGGAVGRSRAQIVSIHSSRPSASLEAVKAVEEALLTADEDGLLVQFYVDKCMEVCKFLQLPDRVLVRVVVETVPPPPPPPHPRVDANDRWGRRPP